MSELSESRRLRLIKSLEAYKRPGTPVFAYHYRKLPAEVMKPGNADVLLGILQDEKLPAKARDHAAGALGQIECVKAIPSLIAFVEFIIYIFTSEEDMQSKYA